MPLNAKISYNFHEKLTTRGGLVSGLSNGIVSNTGIKNTVNWQTRDFWSCDFDNGASESKTVKLRMFTVIIDLLGAFKW